MMDTKEAYFSGLLLFWQKSATGTGTGFVSDAVSKNQQLAKDHTRQLLENFKNVKYIHL